MAIEEMQKIGVQLNPAGEVKPAAAQRVATASVQAQKAQAAEKIRDAGSQAITQESFQETLDSLNEAVSILNHRLSFKLDDSTGRMMTKVVDRETNEVIREFPSKEMIAFVERFQEFIGLLLNEQA
jgi:flagellar protein FlaG